MSMWDMVGSSKISRLMKGWCLASVLCPCGEPLSPLHKKLDTWEDYYEWRCIPLHSPVAILLDLPLTLYWAVQLTLPRSLNLKDLIRSFLNLMCSVNCVLFLLAYKFSWSM